MGNYIRPRTVLNDCVAFRKLMGLKTTDPDELYKLFGNLCMASAMCLSTRKHPDATEDELRLVESATDALIVEYPIRFAMRITKPLHEIIEKLREETNSPN